MPNSEELDKEVEKRSVKVKCRQCRAEYEYDNDFWDGTDGAHPSWWRGKERGYREACDRINQALDMEITHEGFNDPLRSILEKIETIIKENKELKDVIWQLTDYAALGEVIFCQSGRFPHMVNLLKQICEKFGIKYELMEYLVVEKDAKNEEENVPKS